MKKLDVRAPMKLMLTKSTLKKLSVKTRLRTGLGQDALRTQYQPYC